MKFRVILEQEDTGGYSASCPTLPGYWSQVDTRDEVIACDSEFDARADETEAPVTAEEEKP